ncbi:YAR1 [Sanghuangporus sanghuang]
MTTISDLEIERFPSGYSSLLRQLPVEDDSRLRLPPSPSPSPDDIDELLLDCRYGDLDCARSFVERYGAEALLRAHDERGNTALHMCVANGHHEILAYLLSLSRLPVSLLTSPNDAGNTPLHWACLNGHLECVKRLVTFKPDPIKAEESVALGPALVLVRNRAGQTPLGEAERAGWEEGARWLVSVMDLQVISETSVEDEASAEDIEGVGEADTTTCQDGEKEREEIEIGLARLDVSEDTPAR